MNIVKLLKKVFKGGGPPVLPHKINDPLVIDGEAFMSGKYKINANIIVDRGKLYIAPGSELRFNKNSGIIAEQGELFADGKELEKILFDELEQGKGWKGVILKGPKCETHTIDNCIFQNASGLTMIDTKVDIIDSDFTGNRVRKDKGAVYAENSRIYIKKSSFFHNIGTAILAVNSKGLISRSIVEFNEVGLNLYPGGYSGGIALSDGCDFIIRNSSISYNSGSTGGVSAYNSKLIVETSYFMGNKGYNGGAIHIGFGEPELIVVECVFSKNSAVGKGGAICVQDFSKTDIKNSQFSHNSAYDGGAISFSYVIKDDQKYDKLKMEKNEPNDIKFSSSKSKSLF